ncbi:hypothetical protein OS493_004439 [Desmophyllum pertusum]|uniref:Transmembrane protein 134 n=1 Tax=Desmophyllum pertusum TaxID=174260 RepID=A0A9W9ZT97_9CNID|nr:hypothetical protein OS493_004439 [Desmophyllum pertusum]
MASNVPYSQENELLNSGSDEEDSDDISETATRTRSKKKARVPRPIEPNVQVQNDQENAGRSGEVSEDRDLGYGDIWSANKFQASSSSYGANSDRRKTESVGGNSLEFDSQEDVSSFKKETLFWLRHPRIRENWKTVTAAFLLFVAGIAFLLAGIILAATEQDGMKSVIFFVCAAICILPGGYHIIYIYRATKGQRGYNFESIPSFQ